MSNNYDELVYQTEYGDLFHAWSGDNDLIFTYLTNVTEEGQVWRTAKISIKDGEVSMAYLGESAELTSELVNIFYDVEENKLISCLTYDGILISDVNNQNGRIILNTAPEQYMTCSYNYKDNMLLLGTSQVGYLFKLNLKDLTAE